MKSHRSIVILVACLAILFSCENEGGARRVEVYYYPLKDLEEGKVYEYQSVGNPNDPPIYWHFKTLKNDTAEFLLGTSYGPSFSPDQFTREEKVDNGMLLAEFCSFEKDTAGNKQRVRANIEAANVFPFEVKNPPGVLLTTIRWRPLTDTAAYIFVRNRQFDSDTTVFFQGKSVPAIKFNLRELVDQEVEGHLELEYAAAEVYAKGIGLVYFSKDITDGWLMRYALKDIYGMAAFEQKFKTKLPAAEQGH